jgi:2,3-bisphosphoglycerate-independent phosphoglycerate mutase
MERLERYRRLASDNGTKILFWVFDGVGGLPHPDTGLTELETAKIPCLDAFAGSAACGGFEPFGAGVTPGSGPGHLALFGYPLDDIDLSRGVVEMLGASTVLHHGEEVPFALGPNDLAMRGNYASRSDATGEWLIADRRAGGISTEESRRVSEMLSRSLGLDGYEIYVAPGKGHRFALVIRGPGLVGGLSDADPQKEGLAPIDVQALRPQAETTASRVNHLIRQATDCLADEVHANTVLVRGIGMPPAIPTLPELYQMRCAAIATYPMYRGIARLVGMDILDVPSTRHEDEVTVLEENFERYDFFFLHIKETDGHAHTGDFGAKVAVFEECDPLFQRAISLGFDVVVVTGDHCTPSVLKEHSWHPIPTALWSKHCLCAAPDSEGVGYSERSCIRGTMGLRPSRDLLPLALAEAGRFKKFGA